MADESLGLLPAESDSDLFMGKNTPPAEDDGRRGTQERKMMDGGDGHWRGRERKAMGYLKIDYGRLGLPFLPPPPFPHEIVLT